MATMRLYRQSATASYQLTSSAARQKPRNISSKDTTTQKEMLTQKNTRTKNYTANEHLLDTTSNSKLHSRILQLGNGCTVAYVLGSLRATVTSWLISAKRMTCWKEMTRNVQELTQLISWTKFAVKDEAGRLALPASRQSLHCEGCSR